MRVGGVVAGLRNVDNGLQARSESEQPPMQAAVSYSIEATEALEKQVADLSQRLRPVLGPEYPTNTEGAGKAIPTTSPLAEAVSEHNRRLLLLSNTLSDLLRRLEV